MSIPVTFYNRIEAERAYRRHAALVQAENRDPSLAMCPEFERLRKDAYETFCKAFEGQK
jgi:hypothetical protein